MDEQQDDHVLDLSLTLKCPDLQNNHTNNHVNHSSVPPPSKLLSSLPPCPFKLIPSPYNFLTPDHPIFTRPPNYKPPSFDDIDQEITAYIEEKRREAVAMAEGEKEMERQREVEEEVMVSSPNSAVSTTSLSGNKRMEREENYEAEEKDMSSQYIIVSDDDEDGGDAVASAAARKKLRLSKEQAAVLEETFKEYNTLNTRQKSALAKQLDLRPRQVEVWFQNRRARTKLKQTEMDCAYLRRCCKTLSEENKRLQKELTELKAIKSTPLQYMNMHPPTTLIMCPQCERVTTPSSSTRPFTTVGAANTSHQEHIGLNRSKSTFGIPFSKLISSEALDVPRRPQP